jgi:hypothetical protein
MDRVRFGDRTMCTLASSGPAEYEPNDDMLAGNRRSTDRWFLILHCQGCFGGAVLLGQPKLVWLDRGDPGRDAAGVGISNLLPEKMVELNTPMETAFRSRQMDRWQFMTRIPDPLNVEGRAQKVD